MIWNGRRYRVAVPSIRIVPWAALAFCWPLPQQLLPVFPFLSLCDIFPRPGEVFCHWRRSSLHSGHIQRKNYFIISEYRSVCGRSGIPFSREGFGTNSLSQSLTALPAPSRREPLTRPQALRFRRKRYRHAKGPIPEDDFPRPGEDVAAGDRKGNLSP